MTIYYVDGEEYFSLSEAKKQMRQKNCKGTKVKVYSNGDWVPCGEITLNGSNKSFITNTRMKQPNY